ncbi:peptidylprolyl isomerase, partial [Chloroflexota bacterium]
DVANEVLGNLNENESFLQLAKRYSAEEYSKERSGELGWITAGAGNVANGKFSNSLLSNIAFNTELGTVSQPIYDPSVLKTGGYWLLEVIERDNDKGSHVKGILVGSESEALELKEELNKGADFAELAKEKSQHLETKGFGGDLGFVNQMYDNAIVVKTASEFPIGVLSPPIFDNTVQTKGGYWLIKVLEKADDKELDAETRDKLKAKAFQDWLEEERQSSDIELYMDEKQKAWAVEYTFKKLGIEGK